jgi:alpha-galactosidase
MKYLTRLIETTAILLLIACSNRIGTNTTIMPLEKGWKFKAGNDLAWAKPDFDDSKWDTISVSKYWENLGHKDYNGVAWYRIKVFLPSSLKENAYLKESLQIFLGKIDDGDQLYFNGKFIGQNNKRAASAPVDSLFIKAGSYAWAERKYLLDYDDPCILWDKENVIAVRIMDLGGGGGMYEGKPAISMIDIPEKLIIDKSTYAYEFDKGVINKRFALKNNSKVDLNGKFIIEAVADKASDFFFRSEEEVKLKPGESKEFPVKLKAREEAGKIKLVFKHSDSKCVITSYDDVPYILTPKPLDEPKINGPKLIGVHPGNPFLFTIPASGKRPLTYKVENLPKGLVIDSTTGIITGKVLKKGEYKVIFKVRNGFGEDKRDFKIVVGDKLALTPPLGWNSYNSWCDLITDDIVIKSAHAFVDKGLIDHGWAFVNIDDSWQANRNEKGEIVPNGRFKHMKAMIDSVHGLGLKFGIYSSPGPKTCGGYIASYQHELQDAKTFAGWGADLLKYDWCTYSTIAKDKSLPELKKPYIVMQKALSEVNRDIIYSLCQYGDGDVWEWGEEVGGNMWRTAFDITDTWESMSKIGFADVKNAAFAGPGHWNDLDMMVIGWVGWGEVFYPSRLTTDEQYTHMSLWSLIAAPLIIGCDLFHLDDFTLNLLTNDEVLGINQDVLGKQAIRKVNRNGIQIWVKELEDGSKAAGIFNLNQDRQEFSFDLAEIGLSGTQKIRDLWRQKDIGAFEGKFKATIPAHGVVLVKLSDTK